MDDNIIAQSQQAVKGFILADGVYDYPDPVDKFVVIIGGEEVAWAGTLAQAERSFIELIHYDAAHRQRCPSDYIPFDGVAPESDDWPDDYALELPL